MTEIIKEQAYGIIPLCKKETGAWQLLLVQNINGHFWGFPKGHSEIMEDPQTAARRELKEETNLAVVNFLPYEPLVEHYQYPKEKRLMAKTVFYFLAEVAGDVTRQIIEIENFRWVEPAAAVLLVTYPSTKKICRDLLQLLCF